MDSAPEVPNKRAKKLPKIAKFAAESEPVLPTGKSTIEIIKDSYTRDLKSATEDANKQLESLSSGVKIDVITDESNETSAIYSEDITDLDEPETAISDELTETDNRLEQPEEEPTIEPTQKPQIDDLIELDEDGLPDDPLTIKAINDIVAKEADMVLDAEDEEREAMELAKEPLKRHGIIGRLLGHTSVRWGILIALFVVLLAATFTPYSRYYVLDKVGVRSTLSLKVVDSLTLLPLKNVDVSAGDSVAQTDAEGIVKLTNVRLGKTKLIIEKRAFTRLERNIVIGWGSNPLGDFQAQATGAQYTLIAKDFLSGKPLGGAEAFSGEGSAVADKDGKIVLTLDTANRDDASQIEITIRAENYRDEIVSVSVSNKEEQAVELVPARKHTFLSKRSGNYDVYTVDIDGKNEQKIVEGTGLERDDIALIPHQRESLAALISTRERVTNPSGFLLSTLYLIDTSNGKLTKVDQSEKIQIIGWSKAGRLVYLKVATGADGTDSNRHRIMSLNFNNFADIKELAAANAFNDILMASDRVYYAPSIGFSEDTAPGVFSIGPDGQDRRTLLDDVEAFALKRSAYETLDVRGSSAWYSYTIGSSGKALINQNPTEASSRLYTDNLSSNFSLWVGDQSGKGVLSAYDKTARKDRELISVKGLSIPVYWLNNSVAVYRVKDNRSTADYAVSIDGGGASKITDVADSIGIDHLQGN